MKKIKNFASKVNLFNGLKICLFLLITFAGFSKGFAITVTTDKTSIGPQNSANKFVIKCTIDNQNSNANYTLALKGFFDDSGNKIYDGLDNYSTSIDVNNIGVIGYSVTDITFTFDLSNSVADGYKFKIVFNNFNNVDITYSSSFITFMRDNDPPSKPIVNDPIPTGNSAAISWNACSDYYDPNVLYSVRLVNSNDGTLQTINNLTNTSYTITGLTGLTNYGVYVTALDHANNQNTSAKKVFTTLCGPLENINLKINNNSTGNISLIGDIYYIDYNNNFEVKINNPKSDWTYTSNYTTGIIQEVYGGYDFRAYHPIGQGDGYVTISGKQNSCSSTTSTTKNIFIRYNTNVPTPSLSGFVSSSMKILTFYMQGGVEIRNIVDKYYWQVYENDILIREYNSPTEWVCLVSYKIGATYKVKLKVHSYKYMYESQWGEKSATIN